VRRGSLAESGFNRDIQNHRTGTVPYGGDKNVLYIVGLNLQRREKYANYSARSTIPVAKVTDEGPKASPQFLQTIQDRFPDPNTLMIIVRRRPLSSDLPSQSFQLETFLETECIFTAFVSELLSLFLMLATMSSSGSSLPADKELCNKIGYKKIHIL